MLAIKAKGPENTVYWIQGLHPKTDLKMANAGLTTKAEILERIQLIERKLWTSTLTSAPGSTKETKQCQPSPIPTKYCQRHGTGLHATSECRVLNKLKVLEPPKRENKEPHLYMLSEPDFYPKGLIFKGILYKLNVKIQPDPGATRSIINKNLAAKLNILTRESDAPIRLSGVFGDSVTITHICDTQLQFNQIPDVKIKQTLYVIPGKLDVILFGKDFMKTHEVHIDYRDGRVRIHDYYIYFTKKL